MVVGKLKLADDPTATVRAQAAASPLPQVTIPTIAASAGKKGPIGTAPRTNYSRVNTGVPSISDAGSAEQKSLSPKVGSPMNQISRPTLQTMLKSAQAGALSRTKVAAEARRQLSSLEKVGGEMCEGCKKDKGECTCSKKKEASSKITTAYVEKVAGALEYLALEVQREDEAAKTAAANAPPAHITETTQMPGKGPGALEVSHATASTPLPDHKGQGHAIVPMHPGTEKVLKPEHGATAMETNEAHAPGGSGKTPQQVVPKHASLVVGNLERMLGKEAASKVKVAEDAINPAHISAGPAVAPETSAAGQSGGEPVGGAPKGPTGLVGSNEGAINYTKGQAKSPDKSDLKTWFQEPAMTSSTDSTLQAAFSNTGKAGVKISSAQATEETVKTAAARALLENLLVPKTESTVS